MSAIGYSGMQAGVACCSAARGLGEKKKTYATDSVVFVVIFRFLNHVSTDDGFVAVVLVGFVGDEVGLAEELLLVVLELAHHLGRLEVCKSQALVCTAC